MKPGLALFVKKSECQGVEEASTSLNWPFCATRIEFERKTTQTPFDAMHKWAPDGITLLTAMPMIFGFIAI